VLALYYSEIYSEAISEEARFPRLRYRMVRAELERRQIAATFWAPPEVTPEELSQVHDPNYVQAFLEERLDERAQRRIGLMPWNRLTRPRTLQLIGGSLAATRHALETHGFAGNLGGGTHHAHRDFGSGFCVFNDLAVAAAAAIKEHGLTRILIVDLDVHQGDGTAAIFQGEPRVFTFSVHCGKNFPFRKQQSDLDVELPVGAGDAEYLAALEHHLPQVFFAQRPELVLYQAGVDPLASDHLGKLSLSREGLAARNDRVFRLAAENQVPLVILMGGGYSRPLTHSIECHADVFEQASKWAGTGAATL
jgi:acetoin utilization deacetylase AcuC-like enzyme